MRPILHEGQSALGWTLPVARETLRSLRPRRKFRPPEFSRKRFDRLNVRAGSWSLSEDRFHACWARFETAKADIETFVLYPGASPGFAPVIAAEFVFIGGAFSVIVLDAEPVVDDPDLCVRLESVFLPLKKKFESRFETRARSSQWFDEIRTPWSIYASGPAACASDLRAAFHAYLQVGAREFYSPLSQGAPISQSDPDSVIEYKRHHSEHSPARKLAPFVDGAWLDSFLNRWHFGAV